MGLIEKLHSIPGFIRAFRRQPGRGWAIGLSALAFLATEGAVLYAEHHYSHLWIWAHLMLLPVAVLSVVLGFFVAHDEPFQRVLQDQHAPEAPFVLSRVIALWQEMNISPNSRADRVQLRTTLQRVREQVVNLRNPTKFVARLAPIIQTRAVWAICGRKDEQSAKELYEACVTTSRDNHNHVERIFFPPNTRSDAEEILRAIEVHLEHGMTVRVFRSHHEADMALHDLHLPRGFGMTWIGEGKRDGQSATKDPLPPGRGPTPVIFIHWGGLGSKASGGDHRGIIVEDALWAKHMWETFKEVRHHTEIANVGPDNPHRTVPMTRAEFLAKFRHYRGPRP